jgi:PAS domain S-box-containing protein
LSFASPESDFYTNAFASFSGSDVGVRRDYIHHIPMMSHHRENMAYALSFASPDSDFSSPLIVALLDERMKQQLEYSLTHGFVSRETHPDFVGSILQKQDDLVHEAPLPSTLAAALRSDDPRAIVVTEAHAPFRIVSVNPAWETLCGFQLSECQGQTLKCIQGPETNQSAVTALMSQLLRGEEAGTVLTNYTKYGRKFQNRIRVRPLKDEFSRITHFVGVLREVVDRRETFAAKNSASMTWI